LLLYTIFSKFGERKSEAGTPILDLLAYLVGYLVKFE